MKEIIFFVWIGLLLATAVLYLVLVWRLFRRLEDQHAGIYQSIGSPTLFWNNSPRNNWLFLTFLFSTRHRQMDDAPLSSHIRSLRLLAVVYTVGVTGLIGLIIAGVLP